VKHIYYSEVTPHSYPALRGCFRYGTSVLALILQLLYSSYRPETSSIDSSLAFLPPAANRRTSCPAVIDLFLDLGESCPDWPSTYIKYLQLNGSVQQHLRFSSIESRPVFGFSETHGIITIKSSMVVCSRAWISVTVC
jgi:hypothetical protein